QVDFPAPAPVSKVSVFWFSDRPTGGGCDTPQSWRLLYRHDNEWRPVEQPSGFDVASDRFNDGIFTRVTTTALRIEAQLKKDWSGGISEWRVE
ncbi:MAG: glycoside hydrolase family 127 protein, partial [Kiritimatiellae bacterium]|nr:glycoside hydrolase family 127 protein [Kiritimatiellia bacterium]